MVMVFEDNEAIEYEKAQCEIFGINAKNKRS